MQLSGPCCWQMALTMEVRLRSSCVCVPGMLSCGMAMYVVYPFCWSFCWSCWQICRLYLYSWIWLSGLFLPDVLALCAVPRMMTIFFMGVVLYGLEVCYVEVECFAELCDPWFLVVECDACWAVECFAIGCSASDCSEGIGGLECRWGCQVADETIELR